MKYKAFIASTKKDLERQRLNIIEKLRKADIDLVVMEDWTADPDHPAILSAKNIAGCHFCVALIAYQRGVIYANDPKGRSITQIEIDTAKATGVRVLPYILRNSEANKSVWPSEFNKLDELAVQNWRREFESGTTSEFFDANETPDVLPAITRQITKWEQARRARLQKFLMSICVALASVIVIFGTSHSARKWLLSHMHSYDDPVVFQHSRDGSYNVARLLESRSDIQDNTNLREEIASAKDTFVMFSNTFGSFRQYAQDYTKAAERGVKLRFVVTDFSEANRANWESFQMVAEDSPQVLAETQANAANIRGMLDELCQKFPNLVSYKLNKQPILYTLWVRDAMSANGLAHLGIHYYGKVSQTNWPAYRVSNLTGGNQLQILRDQFDVIWSNSIDPH